MIMIMLMILTATIVALLQATRIIVTTIIVITIHYHDKRHDSCDALAVVELGLSWSHPMLPPTSSFLPNRSANS